MRADGPEGSIRDGRRRKGARRRRLLLEAAMRVIERDGTAAVSQRAVAAEAHVPPSAVTYYFATVDDLLVATLTAVNDAYLERFHAFPADDDRALEALAAMIADGAGPNRAHVIAECELFLMAARRPALRPQLLRWTRALDAFLARYVGDPVERAGVCAAVDGLFLHGLSSPAPPAAGEVLTVLRRLTHRPRASRP